MDSDGQEPVTLRIVGSAALMTQVSEGRLAMAFRGAREVAVRRGLGYDDGQMQRVPSPPNGLNDANPFPPDCSAKFMHIRKIAAGGFGAVFQAIHRELKRPV